MEEKKEQLTLEKSTDAEISVSNLKPIDEDEKPSFDFSEFNEAKTTIAVVKTIWTKTKWVDGNIVPCEPRPQLFVESAPLKKYKDKDGKEQNITAREYFNLKVDAEGNVGWSTYKEGKLAKFLKYKKCKNPEQLIGKEVMIKVTGEVPDQKLKFVF